MLDPGFVNYVIDEIELRENDFYTMSCKCFIAELLPELQKVFPAVRIVEYDDLQYVVVNQTALNKLVTKLLNMRKKRLHEVNELTHIIASISKEN